MSRISAIVGGGALARNAGIPPGMLMDEILFISSAPTVGDILILAAATEE